MAPHTGRYTNDAAADRRRTPAQLYCLLAGAALLLAGLFGFLADAGFKTGGVPSGTVEGSPFLGFEVNGWHNLVHLASGLVLLAGANTRPTAKVVALGFGIVYGLVAIVGLIDGSDFLGIIPVNGPDNILHIALALLGILTGLMSKARRGHRRVGNDPALDHGTAGTRTEEAIPGRTHTTH
jgi:hypothetical protein